MELMLLLRRRRMIRKLNIPLFPFQRDVERNCFECNHCSRLFFSADERDRHIKTHFQIKPYTCRRCGNTFVKKEHQKMHEKICGATGGGISIYEGNEFEEDDDELLLQKSTLRGVAKMYKLKFDSSKDHLHSRLGSMMLTHDQLKVLQRADKNVKYYVSLKCRFFQPTDPSVITDPPVVLNSESCSLLPSINIQEQIEVIYLNIEHQIGAYQALGSGWSLLNVVSLNLNIIRYILSKLQVIWICQNN